MNVVFPAPLLPIKPTTASCSTATLMSLAAVTAPKFLFSPFASRTIAMSGRFAPAGKERPQPAGQEHDHDQHRDAKRHLPRVGRIFIGKTADGFENKSAQERRQYVAGTGQNTDKNEFAGSRPVGHFRIDVSHGNCGKGAPDAC